MNTNRNETDHEPHESRMLALVRKWRKEAYEAAQRGEAEPIESLRRKFGLESPSKRRKPAA